MSNIVKICDEKFKIILEIFTVSWFNIKEFYFKLIVWKVIFKSHTKFPKKIEKEQNKEVAKKYKRERKSKKKQENRNKTIIFIKM